MKPIILASQSPRRKQLLEWAEIDFEVLVKETDEHYPGDLPIDEIPVFIARNKALAIRSERPGDPRTILAADTVVVLDNKIIGKPQSREQAIMTLTALSGKEHKVITGVTLLTEGNEFSFSDTTRVGFHALTAEQIHYYVDKYKPYDKAGAYAIQEWIGVTGIKFIEGDFYNVMGLPVSRVVKALQAL